MDYSELLSIKKTVLKTPNLSIQTDKEFSELSSKMVAYLNKIQGFDFPGPVLEFYNACNGFYFGWKSKNAKGNILIPSFLGMFANLMDEEDHENAFEGILWTKEGYEKKEIAERKKHKVFEFFEGDSACITIKFDKDQSYQLYYVDSEIYPLPLSIGAYVKLVADLFGFGNFRHYLHQKEFYSNPLNFCPELNKLHQVFPAFDLKDMDFNQYLSIK